MAMGLAGQIKQKGLELGFDLVGITDACPIEAQQVEILTNWLKFGFAGRMDYMHRNFQKRIDPAKLLEGAQSVIVVGLNYTPPRRSQSSDALQSDVQRSRFIDLIIQTAKVATYAQYEDYHLFIKKQLRSLAVFLGDIAGTGFKFKICVDSAPLAERALAARAGLGFIGKNHMLINPRLGPQIFLGEIITNMELQADEPSKNSCSNCNQCINACPTGALRADGQFDANKCISYLTIESKDRIPFDLTEKIGDWLFGCDECVQACPWQQNAPVCANRQLKFYDDRARLNLQDILNLSQADFETRFAESVIKRLGLERLKRNAKICLANVISQKYSHE